MVYIGFILMGAFVCASRYLSQKRRVSWRWEISCEGQGDFLTILFQDSIVLANPYNLYAFDYFATMTRKWLSPIGSIQISSCRNRHILLSIYMILGFLVGIGSEVDNNS